MQLTNYDKWIYIINHAPRWFAWQNHPNATSKPDKCVEILRSNACGCDLSCLPMAPHKQPPKSTGILDISSSITAQLAQSRKLESYACLVPFMCPRWGWISQTLSNSLRQFSYEGSVWPSCCISSAFFGHWLWGEKSIQFSTNWWGKTGEQIETKKSLNHKLHESWFPLISPQISHNFVQHRITPRRTELTPHAHCHTAPWNGPTAALGEGYVRSIPPTPSKNTAATSWNYLKLPTLERKWLKLHALRCFPSPIFGGYLGCQCFHCKSSPHPLH